MIDFGCVKTLERQFYLDYFNIMDEGVMASDESFIALLRGLNLLRANDTEKETAKLLPLIRESIELLSRPFQIRDEEYFDFGDTAYLAEIAAFGERAREDKELQKMQGGRGNAESLYLNRSYFGLYNLLGQLRAKVKTQMPAFIREKHKNNAA